MSRHYWVWWQDGGIYVHPSRLCDAVQQCWERRQMSLDLPLDGRWYECGPPVPVPLAFRCVDIQDKKAARTADPLHFT